MQRRTVLAIRVLAAAAAIATGGAVAAAPAQADPVDPAFIDALNQAGIGATDPAQAMSVGQSVCPMLAEPGQTVADVAAKVADTGGMPLGPATMFTGVAISTFCPAMVAKMGEGAPADLASLPLSILGF
ncbi:DUF732 domain-containing protein [Mycobacterium sp. LTG2003]